MIRGVSSLGCSVVVILEEWIVRGTFREKVMERVIVISNEGFAAKWSYLSRDPACQDFHHGSTEEGFVVKFKHTDLYTYCGLWVK